MIIYMITNLINGKIYIGQSLFILSKRWKEHLSNLNYCKNHLYSAIKKYGIGNFKIEKLLKCSNQKDLDFFEDYYIVVLNTMNPKRGYNNKRGGSGGKLSEDVKKELSKIRKEWHKDPVNKDKHRKAVKDGMNNPDSIKKRSNITKKWHSNPKNKEEHRKAIQKAMDNPEIKERQRKALNTPEIKKRHIEGIKRSWTPERREAQSKKGKEYRRKERIKYEKAKQENDFINMRYWDLYDKARELKVENYCNLNKQELTELLENVIYG